MYCCCLLYLLAMTLVAGSERLSSVPGLVDTCNITGHSPGWGGGGEIIMIH